MTKRALNIEIVALKNENSELKSELTELKLQMKELLRLIHGSKSERHTEEVNPEQLGLFEKELPKVIEPSPTEEISYTRSKNKHKGRNPLPDHLPVNEIIIEPEEDTTGMIKIGEERTDTLDYKPASLVVNRYIRPKYAPKDGEGVYQAPMPCRPIERGLAEAGLLAFILVQKFVYHMPFYRTIAQFKQLYQYELSKSTVNDWFISVYSLMKPLYACLKKQVLLSTYIQADESPIKVLDKNKPKNTHKGYYWVYHAPKEKLAFFDYQKGRGKDGPKRLLEDYKGYLQTDGYVVYDKVAEAFEGIILLGCMAHARRYFFKAKDNDLQRANIALQYFKQLYAIEQQINKQEMTPQQTKKHRLEKSKPVLDELIQWAIQEKGKVAPKSLIGKAFTYLTLQWTKLTKYLEDGRLCIDNNFIENTIRPLAVGRKNYLFAGSSKGAERIAMMYSFFATCKMNDVNPFIWLRETLKRIPQHPVNRIEELLPGDWVKQFDM